MYREAVVKNYFYPSDPKKLANMFTNWQRGSSKKDVAICIVPHAGYVFSGEVAFQTLSNISLKKRIILMGPNHTGFGQRVSIYPAGSWETPFGNIDTDTEIIERLISKGFKTDTLAHLKEHSLEVITPMLKYLRNDITITPITIAHLSLEECKTVAEKIYEAIEDILNEITFVISSDFNHFEDEKTTIQKDNLAIKEILNLAPENLYNTIKSNEISMCGFIPTTIALYIAKKLNITNAELLKHTTSAAVSGDYDRVVGYAGIILKYS
ncbi:MAG: AmmeMemoRadiSam system protein B [Calditerrivibrio sp.]|nr:AmmeMemoRadiSam system protein B [Calditerrivibrio sp.]